MTKFVIFLIYFFLLQNSIVWHDYAEIIKAAIEKINYLYGSCHKKRPVLCHSALIYKLCKLKKINNNNNTDAVFKLSS